MPSLIDIFNPSFFMFLGILVLVVALMVVYFESKMREQNHKMSSMLNLVTFMAEEMNVIKNNLHPFNHSQAQESHSHGLEEVISGGGMAAVKYIEANKLISVSDDEDEDINDDESDSGSDTNSDSEPDNGSDSDSDSENEVIEISELSDIKVLKLNTSNDIQPNNLNTLGQINLETDDFNDIDDLDDVDDLDDNSISTNNDNKTNKNNDNIKSIILVENILPNTDKNINQSINIGSESLSDLNLKSIHISNLEEPKISEHVDYKKLSINKLRSVAIEKGLVDELTKLKKGELLKLLGAE